MFVPGGILSGESWVGRDRAGRRTTFKYVCRTLLPMRLFGLGAFNDDDGLLESVKHIRFQLNRLSITRTWSKRYFKCPIEAPKIKPAIVDNANSFSIEIILFWKSWRTQTNETFVVNIVYSFCDNKHLSTKMKITVKNIFII